MTLSQIAQEFDEFYKNFSSKCAALNGTALMLPPDEIKAYWLSHFRTLVEEMKKEIRCIEKNDNIISIHHTNKQEIEGYSSGYNEALTHTLSILNKYL
jgi:hypothetical protein